MTREQPQPPFYFDLIKNVPNFPKEGILFKDITPIFENHKAFAKMTEDLAELASSSFEFNKLALIESRGFLLGSALALHLSKDFCLVRKQGKLPQATFTEDYELEYGSDSLEIHRESLCEQDRVLLVDDLLATGGTLRASEKLCMQTGAQIAGSISILELQDLKGAKNLIAPHKSLFQV